MVESDVTTVWQLLVTAILSSGVAVALIESFRNWLFKRREEFIEQSKQKIDTISKATPYYNQLAMNSWNFSEALAESKNPDYERLMYNMCNMLYFRHQIIQKFGDLQFDNLQAEKVIYTLWSDISTVIEKKFGYLDTSRLRYLVENNIPYHKFHDIILNENKDLYYKFVEWLKTEVTNEDKEHLKKGMWYTQLIQLELNHIYKSWYGEEPPLVLRPELKEYLATEQPKYYDRIKSFHLKTRPSCKP
jgi:hypothetical protein